MLLLRGPYGSYAQLGPTVEGAQTKPRRASWPQHLPIATADLETALKVLSLPRTLGNHPETGKPIEANVGRFGPYVKHDGAFKSIPKSDSVYDITLERAVELLAAPKTSRGPEGKQLGPHPIDNQPVQLMDGRYGPYIKHGKVNVTVPTDMDAATLTLDDAVDLLAEKAAKELAKTGSTAARPIAAQRPRTSAARATARRRHAARGQRTARAGRRSAWQRRGAAAGMARRMAVARKRAGANQPNRAAGNRSGSGKGKPAAHPQRQPAQRAAAARSGARRRPA